MGAGWRGGAGGGAPLVSCKDKPWVCREVQDIGCLRHKTRLMTQRSGWRGRTGLAPCSLRGSAPEDQPQRISPRGSAPQDHGISHTSVSPLRPHFAGGKFRARLFPNPCVSACVRASKRTVRLVSSAAHAGPRVRTCGLQGVLQPGPKG